MRGIRKYHKNNAVWYWQSIQNQYKWVSPLFAEPFLQATGRCNSVVVQSFSHLGGISINNFLGCTNSQIVLNRGRNEKWINKTDQVLDFSHLSLSWNWGASIERSCLRVFGRRGNGCDGTSTDNSHAPVLVRRVPAILHQYTYLKFHNHPITYNSSQMFHAWFIRGSLCEHHIWDVDDLRQAFDTLKDVSDLPRNGKPLSCWVPASISRIFDGYCQDTIWYSQISWYRNSSSKPQASGANCSCQRG